MVGEASEYNEKLYCGPIQEAVLAAGLAEGSLSEVPSVVYKGTKYSRGFVVVMDENENGLVFGKISVILVSCKSVHFILDMLQSVHLTDVGLHCLGNHEGKFICAGIDSLCDYYPLPVYEVSGLKVISLHHAVYYF